MNVSNAITMVPIRPKDVSPSVTNKVLSFLNSINKADEFARTVDMFAGEKVLSTGIAQKILNKKEELGGFKDLQQIAVVPRIGTKKFTAIVSAISQQI